MVINNLTRKQKAEVKKEVEKQTDKIEKKLTKKLHKRLFIATRAHAGKFKNEVKKHTTTAITAAFGFLIALSWRTPIQNSVNNMIESFGLIESAIYYEYLSAIFITIIAVLALMIVAKWTSDSVS
jgi:hypothetical protein